MHRFNTALYLALVASLLCTACDGGVAGPASKAETTGREFVVDLVPEKGEVVTGGTVLAKVAAR